MKKIYLLTKSEQELINQRRAFNRSIIKENEDAYLLFQKENDEYTKAQMRKRLAEGKSITIDESMYPHKPPINQIFSYIKRKVLKS